MMDSAYPALDEDAVLWTPGDRTGKPLLVLLHGYGANEQDLFGLVPYLPDAFSCAAVRAPLNPPWPAPGYSWYPIDDLSSRDPENVTAAATRLIEWLDAAAGATEVGLLGFSQGGAVALQTLRIAPERFGFAVNLSGYATPGALPGDTVLGERKPPVFWGRGARDEVIPEPLILHTVDWLPGHSELSGRVYPELAHGVAEDELADIRVFLEKWLAERDAST